MLSYTDDITSVDSLTSASPHVSAVLKARPSIAQNLLLAAPSMCHAEIKQLWIFSWEGQQFVANPVLIGSQR